MTEFNREEIGDRLDNLDLLRDMILGEQLDDYEVKINALEAQLNSMRQEMKAQGDQVQNALNQKIDEVLNALQISQFSTPQKIETPAPPPSAPPQPTRQQQDRSIDNLFVPPPVPPSALPQPTQQLSPPPPPSNPVPISTPVIEQNPPRSPVPQSSVSQTPMESEFNGFFDQINSILQDSNPDPKVFTEPTPEAIAAPSSPSPELTAMTTDEATQINQLRNLLLDEDLIRLRQTNDTLDLKLRQVEICLANQKPIQNLLLLMMELFQLKIKATQSFNVAQLPVTKKAFPWRIFAGFMLLLLLIPLGWYGYRLWREYQLQKEVAIALTTDPELALYRLSADVKGNQLDLVGTVPNEMIRDQAAEISSNIVPDLTLNNQISVVNSDSLKQAEIQQVLDSFNGKNGIQIESQLEGDRLILNGKVFREIDISSIMTALEKMSGIEQITNNIQIQSQPIKANLYFDQNSAAVKPDDIDQKLTLVKKFLQEYPDLNVLIIGYQHPTETAADVALKRAQATQVLLENQEIDRQRMITLGVNQSPPNITAEEPIWLSRTVLFEIVFPN